MITPNARSLGHELFGASWRGLEPPRHLQVFTPRALARLARSAGFSRVDVETTGANAYTFGAASAAIARIASREATEFLRVAAARAVVSDSGIHADGGQPGSRRRMHSASESMMAAVNRDVSVIIVSFNCRELVRQCLRQIPSSLSGYTCEIIVVDNGSHDGTPEAIRMEFPHVHLHGDGRKSWICRRQQSRPAGRAEAASLCF